jgi:3-oxoacyl-[acyl-carrier protein] reductase
MGSLEGVGINDLKIGDTASCEVVVTEQEVEQFASLSADTNPLHMDAGVAAEYGFPRRVAHGMLALSAISRLIGTRLPGAGTLWLSQEFRFVAPVFVGDRLRARVTVEGITRAVRIVTLRTEVTNVDTDAVVLVGSAKVKVLEKKIPRGNEKMTDRVALITGSSRGLGRVIALKLASTDVKVVVQYQRREDEANSVVKRIAEGGGQAVACRADLSRASEVDALFHQASDAFGRVDVIVNNATPPIIHKPALQLDWTDFGPYLDVYVRASFRLIQLAAPGMQTRHFGRVINILSTYALGVPPAGLGAYVTAKSALVGLSRALAVELGPSGITVNMVAPSMLITDQTAGIGDRARLLAASQAPLRRLAELDDVANTVSFLASDAAAFITGAVIPVAGGTVMVA